MVFSTTINQFSTKNIMDESGITEKENILEKL